MEFFYVDQCERAVPWAARKGDTNKSEIRYQTLAIGHLTSNQFRCCGESSFCFTHEFFYDFLHGLYFREVGEGHAG